MRLIDGDKLQEFPIRANRCDKEHANEHFINGIETVLEYAEQLPTVDAEVVVRCKDCKHSTLPSELTQRYGVPGTRTCHNRYSPCNRRNVSGDDFCSYGERKDCGDAEG